MDLTFTPEEQRFREEVRAFLDSSLPAPVRHLVLEGLHVPPEATVEWQRTLHRKGWGGPNWPAEFGGTGWDPVRQYIFEEECAAAGAPRLLPFGLKMVGPVIMRFGSEAQRRRFLPRILSGEDWWCQGYSEPESGSDLASLRTRAERQGDHYLVNGQKTWITLAQHADWIFCLVRTDRAAKAQAGISFLLVDMRTPGVTVRPIIMLDGGHEVNGQKTWITLAQHADWIFCLVRTDRAAKAQAGISFLLVDMRTPGVTVRPIVMLDGGHEVNEVWFEDVKVPVENLVGEENKGWTYAKFLLGHERANIAGIGGSKRELARLKRIAATERKHGRPIAEDPAFAARLAQVEIDLMALEITNLRVLSAEAEKRAPGPEASLLKIKGTEIQQALTELMVQAVGPYALPFRIEALSGLFQGERAGPDYAAPLAATYCNMRKASIYGGSNEIQKNIITQMILGL